MQVNERNILIRLRQTVNLAVLVCIKGIEHIEKSPIQVILYRASL